MATRPFALRHYAHGTGNPLAFWEHHARMMTKAPGLYCTAIGRGRSDVQVPLHWLASTFLSGVIDDPKNAAVEVPRYGDLRLHSRRAETREVKREGNALNYYAPSHELIHVEPLDGIRPTYSTTFFEDFQSEIDVTGRNWNTEHHKLLHKNYVAEVNLGAHPSIHVSVEYERVGDIARSLHLVYAAAFEQTEMQEINTPAPIQRRVVITGRHITLLGMLWADTLEHTTVVKTDFEPPMAEGGSENVEQSTSLLKSKTGKGKTAKAVEAPPPTAFDNLGSPASSQAFQRLDRPDDTLSLSPRARAGMLDAVESLQGGHPSSPATLEHPNYVKRIAC